MKRHLVFVALIFLCTNLMKSQNVEGKVTDVINDAPVDGAFVTLLTKAEKALIVSTYTEADGHFSINQAVDDSTFLSVSAIGYKDTLIALPPLLDAGVMLGDIRLELDKNVRLDEVVVTAKPYVLRKGTDRIVMSLTGKNELVKNSTIFGVLRYTPMLKVDEVQGISMIGKKNLVVYINGRKSTMSGAEVQNYLNSVPADNIKNIELITNPGSRFDVSAQTGVLNINLKRGEHEGLKGFASAQMWQTHYNKQIASLNLNYVKGIFNMKSAFTARNLADWSKSESITRFPASGQVTERNSMSKNRRQLYQGNIDLSFVPDKKQTFGAVVDFSWWDGNPTSTSVSRYTGTTTEEAGSVYSDKTKSDVQTGRLAVNLNYVVKFNAKNSLSIDADYQYYKMNQKDRFTSHEASEENLSSGYYQHMPQDNNLWMGLAEYTTKFSDRQKLILGTSVYSSTSDNKSLYRELVNLSSQFYPDSRFDYKERNASGYLSYESQWSDKFSTSIGLRYEHTAMEGDSRSSQQETFHRDYGRWLPSLSVTYVPTQQLYVWYSLASQNTYPMYEYLNPFKKYQTVTSYSTGNPDLTPSSTYYQELGCYVNSRYMFLLSYYVTTDATDVFTQKEDDNVEATLPINYGKESGVSLSMNLNFPLLKNRWLLNATLMGRYTHYNSSNYPHLDIDKGHFYGELNLDNTFVLSKKYAWKLLCNYQFRTADQGLVTKTESDMRGSMEIRKDIKDWSFSASYYRSWNYNDGRYSNTRRSRYITSDLERSSLSVGEYQGFMLKVSYNWGNKKVRSGKKHQPISGNQKGRYGGNK